MRRRFCGNSVIKIFLHDCGGRTISQAAEVLHITQPTLSRQLKELEDELGTALFTRDNRKMVLTEAGVFKSRAEEILSLTDQTMQAFEDRKNIYLAVTSRLAVWKQIIPIRFP